MRYGVISDIHSNIEAFEAALDRLTREKVDKYIFCGDLIGYGPDPKACIDLYGSLVKKDLVQGVLGNHDGIVVHPELQAYFHPEALKVLEWTLKQLSPQDMRVVSFLPAVVRGSKFMVVHGTPRDPLKEYFVNTNQYHALYDEWKGQILFIGHSHIPFYMSGNEKRCKIHLIHEEHMVVLMEKARYVINPGSVGRPRDNNPLASFGVWDTSTQEFLFLREEYDWEKTQRKMRKAGIPGNLTETLSMGL